MAGTQAYNVMFEGDMITTTVTSSGKALEDWLDEVLSIHRWCLQKHIVGLAVECHSSYSTDQNPITVLHLCVGRRCLIFQVIHAGYFADKLEDFIGDSGYRFVIVGMEDNTERLWKDWQPMVEKMVDLANLSVEETDCPSLRRTGLKDIASAVMGVDTEKPYRLRTSKWDAYNLFGEKINYACIDSFVSFEVDSKLLSEDY